MKKKLLTFARSRLGGILFSWTVAHMSFAIPAERLYETDQLVAFEHPSPAYTTHILIVPKKHIRALQNLDPADTRLIGDLIRCLQTLTPNLETTPGGYRLVLNGGDAQEVDHLHFHLIAGESLS